MSIRKKMENMILHIIPVNGKIALKTDKQG